MDSTEKEGANAPTILPEKSESAPEPQTMENFDEKAPVSKIWAISKQLQGPQIPFSHPAFGLGALGGGYFEQMAFARPAFESFAPNGRYFEQITNLGQSFGLLNQQLKHWGMQQPNAPLSFMEVANRFQGFIDFIEKSRKEENARLRAEFIAIKKEFRYYIEKNGMVSPTFEQFLEWFDQKEYVGSIEPKHLKEYHDERVQQLNKGFESTIVEIVAAQSELPAITEPPAQPELPAAFVQLLTAQPEQPPPKFEWTGSNRLLYLLFIRLKEAGLCPLSDMDFAEVVKKGVVTKTGLRGTVATIKEDVSRLRSEYKSGKHARLPKKAVVISEMLEHLDGNV